MTHFVRQRTQSDCVIAAVANATGTAYRKVKSVFGRVPRGGVEYHELRWLLSEFGEWHEVKPRRQRRVSEWLRLHTTKTYVAILRSGIVDEFHAIAIVGDSVYGDFAESWRVVLYYRLEQSP